MSTYFKNGGKININQLQHLGNSIIETDAKNKTLLYIPGVLKLPDTISSNFAIQVNGNNTINVGYISTGESNAPFGGVAIDKNGKTISITSNQAYVGSLDTDITFTSNAWTPSRADDPDLTDFGEIKDGGYKRNSGNYNIPFTAGQDNYVYIKYIEIVKQNANSTQSAKGINYETEFTDGYCILVTTTELASGTEWIKIGQIDASGNATNSGMQLGYLNGSTVGAEYHAQTGWSNYPTLSGEYIDLETHINALGTGIPSATNPHGISAADIGANVNNAGFDSISTMTAVGTTSYTISGPLLLDLTVDGAAEAYDIVLLDATNAAENSTVAVRLPEANINTTAYKYTFRNIGQSTGTTVVISSEVTNTQSNKIDGGVDTPVDDKVFSVLTLNTTESVTLIVGLAQGGYNWWRI